MADRDYGRFYGEPSYSVPQVDTVRYGQVYLATHDGSKRLPFMTRSFISFTYDDPDREPGKRKHIEDFNLIAYTNGDRLSRDGYAAFDDTTSIYDNLDGLYYYGTHYRTNSLSLDLTTDGMDHKTLDDFLHWFKAGTVRELILSEHPNRAIMARVSKPPQLNLLPFESDVNLVILGFEYPTKTTLFKGEIVLDFVMDDPFWYAKDNILGVKDTRTNRYLNDWIDANGNLVSIFTSTDALKILYEDGIPLGSSIQNNMLLGNGAFANVENQTISLVWSLPETTANYNTLGVGARVEYNENPTSTLGIVAGAILNASGDGIEELGTNRYGYFFYAGTAPSPTIISFTLTPRLSNYVMVSPYNSYRDDIKYNTFTIESSSEAQHLRFTTPNLWTSYNKVIDIINTRMESGKEWEKMYYYLRTEVRHPDVRKWAALVFKQEETTLNAEDGIISSSVNTNRVKNMMSMMLKPIYSGDSPDPFPATFTFNSKTGEAIGQFLYRVINSSTLPQTWTSFGSIKTVEENVGDMLQSNHIIIKDRNYPTDFGTVVKWEEAHPEYSHRLTHDVEGGLTKVLVLYKNMYF